MNECEVPTCSAPPYTLAEPELPTKASLHGQSWELRLARYRDLRVARPPEWCKASSPTHMARRGVDSVTRKSTSREGREPCRPPITEILLQPHTPHYNSASHN